MPIKLKASDLVRNLTSKYRFIPMLEKSIADNDYEWEFKYKTKKGDDAWHPSGDCTPDIQTLYHLAKDRLDEDSKSSSPSVSLRKTFMVGHFWHQWLQFHAVKSGLVAKDAIERPGTRAWGHSSVGTHPFHWARGSADIAPWTLDGEDWVIDFKTMRQGDFKLETPPERFADKWECQVNIYMDFFGYEKACIIGVDKVEGTMKEFVYYRNQPLVDAIYDKWEIVSGYLDLDEEPPTSAHIELPLKGISE